VISAGEAGRREQEVEEDLVRLDTYRGQLNAMLQQHQYLANSRADHQRARESLEGFERDGDGRELLLPLGAEAFVRGQSVRSNAVLLGIGSGLVVEIDRARAIESIAQRIGRIDQATEEMEGQMRTLDERIAVLSERLDRISRGAAAGGSPAAGDVGRD
jgi:prefoldin alpha subunit